MLIEMRGHYIHNLCLLLLKVHLLIFIIQM